MPGPGIAALVWWDGKCGTPEGSKEERSLLGEVTTIPTRQQVSAVVPAKETVFIIIASTAFHVQAVASGEHAQENRVGSAIQPSAKSGCTAPQ